MSAKAPSAKVATPAAATVATPPAAPKPAKAATSAKKIGSAKAGAAVPVTEVANGVHEEAPKRRQQMTAVLGVDISSARCASHLKENLGDEAIEAEIKALRAQLKDVKEDEAKTKELKDKIMEKSRMIIRIASDTPIAASALADLIVKDVLRHGMDVAIASDHKIVTPIFYHENAQSLDCFPLISKCHAFASFSPEREEELRLQRATAARIAKEAREAKKEGAAAPGTPKGKAAPAPVAAPVPAAAAPAAPAEGDDEEDEGHARSTFNTYVDSALRTVKTDPKYSAMRVSTRTREDLSDIVAQFIERIANVSRVLVDEVAGARTMQAKHVLAAAKIMMVDEGRDGAAIDKIIRFVSEKLGIFHTHTTTVKATKAANLPEEKKAEIERKKHEAELERKKKQAESNKARAVAAATRSKELIAQVHELEPLVAKEKAAAEAAAAAKAAAEAATAKVATELANDEVDALLQV